MTDIEGFPTQLQLYVENVGLKCDVETWRKRSNRWQELAGVYDEIRYALRLVRDTSEGYKEFYEDCWRMIYGDPDDDTD